MEEDKTDEESGLVYLTSRHIGGTGKKYYDGWSDQPDYETVHETRVNLYVPGGKDKSIKLGEFIQNFSKCDKTAYFKLVPYKDTLLYGSYECEYFDVFSGEEVCYLSDNFQGDLVSTGNELFYLKRDSSSMLRNPIGHWDHTGIYKVIHKERDKRIFPEKETEEGEGKVGGVLIHNGKLHHTTHSPNHGVNAVVETETGDYVRDLTTLLSVSAPRSTFSFCGKLYSWEEIEGMVDSLSKGKQRAEGYELSNICEHNRKMFHSERKTSGKARICETKGYTPIIELNYEGSWRIDDLLSVSPEIVEKINQF